MIHIVIYIIGIGKYCNRDTFIHVTIILVGSGNFPRVSGSIDIVPGVTRLARVRVSVEGGHA